jgi:transglutaminase-like putative cysteine protease
MSKSDAAERSFRFQYTTTVREEQSKEGAVQVWVPLPQNTEQQVIGPLAVQSPLPWSEAIEKRGNNRMLYVQVPQGSPSVSIDVQYDVLRKRQHVERPSEDADYGADFDPKKLNAWLSPNANVPTDGFIAQQARAVTNRREPPVVRARKLFDYLMNTLEYDWAGCTPDRIHELGNLAQACDLRKGTCTEFHGLYVGYARAMGIPAKFMFGFNVPDDKEDSVVGGYHCWAEIYLPVVGWFPIDVSEAVKARAKQHPQAAVDFYFGGADCHRVHMTNGRDVVLEPRQPGGLVDKFIFSYAMRGTEKLDPELSFYLRKAL